MALSTSRRCFVLLNVAASRCQASEMSDEKLSGVLQQLGSTGKPSFAAILASNPPTNHPSLLPLYEAVSKDSVLKFNFLGRGPVARFSPQALCSHFEEEPCVSTISSSTLFPRFPMIGRSDSACVLYDACVWSPTLLWPNHTPRLPVLMYAVMVTSTRSPVNQYNNVEWHCQLPVAALFY